MCYGEGCGRVEVFLLLFFEVLFVGLRVVVFGFGGCART